ncbi:MAG: amino acid ABC transporter permease [Propionibacteriaceae bacterium]|jgi:cystine transport system permease protein|nr:amino acid ABC transporter permease [Propionibacteriaceae bacterium]
MNHWQLAVDSFWPLVWASVAGTIPLTLLSFAFGLVLAVLVALARLSSLKPVALIGQFYVSVIRGTPLLVQLFIIFYALPFMGVLLDPYPSAVIAFSVNVGGYAGETIRGAILAVPKGQWEAAAAVTLDYWRTLRRVILPQAFRIAIPPLSNTFIGLVKDTSLASIVMVTELLRRSQIIATPTYDFLTMYTEAALIYWLICTVLSFAQKRVEVRLSKYVTV